MTRSQAPTCTCSPHDSRGAPTWRESASPSTPRRASAGATLHWSLSEAVATSDAALKLEILDSSGAVIRTYEEEDDEAETSDAGEEGDEGEETQRLTREGGPQPIRVGPAARVPRRSRGRLSRGCADLGLRRRSQGGSRNLHRTPERRRHGAGGELRGASRPAIDRRHPGAAAGAAGSRGAHTRSLGRAVRRGAPRSLGAHSIARRSRARRSRGQ